MPEQQPIDRGQPAASWSVFDGHHDALARLGSDEPEAFLREGPGEVDLPKMRAGTVRGAMFAVFVEGPSAGGPMPLAPPLEPDLARASAESMIDALHRLCSISGGAIRLVRSIEDVDWAFDAGGVAAVLHLEGAEAIGPGLSLRDLYERGLRSVGIAWSRPNAFACGVPFRYPSSPDIGPGLTPAGTALVRECNRIGVALDVAHLNAAGFWDVAATSTAPLIASHAGAHALVPHSRNLTDDQLDAIRKSDGLVGVTFDTTLVRPDAGANVDTPVDCVIDHIEYMAGRIGIDHVALGSDCDGAPIPRSIGDIAGCQTVLRCLRDRGWSSGDVTSVAHRNWRRVLQDTWR